MLAVALICLASSLAFAQGSTTSSISGTVVDTGGGVIPGATVAVKNNATGTVTNAVTGAAGTFNIPALEPGTYTVTVSLSGFKTAIVNTVQLTIGSPQTVKATLEVGSLAETVEVKGGATLVNTQTPTISSTLNSDQINQIPMTTRNLVNAVTFLPGVNTAGNNRDSNFNGLPDSFVAISLDGVNNNENFNKSTEGLFAMVTPRPDAVEQVTVTTAGAGADVGGHGAVQVAFVTRSGTNRFTGSAYHYFRDPVLNTNYWFNENLSLPKNDIVLNQYGVRQGGPIVIPNLYDGRGKAFFFFNYEELRLPNNFTRTRTIISPAARAGDFTWNVTQGGVVTATRTVNVLQLAGNAGHNIALDPLVAKLLDQINAATALTGLVTQNTNRNTQSYTWQSPGNQVEKQPVIKVDYNLTSRHRLSGTYNWQVVDRDPDHLNGGDIRFPGFPNYSHYISYRPLASASLRSTLSADMVNEIKGGGRWGPGYFGQDQSNGPQTFDASEGMALGLGFGLTNWHTQNGPSWRSAFSYNLDDTLSWQKGGHSMTFGGSLYFGNVWLRNKQIVPSVGFGVAQADPARGLFNSTNFPGATNDQLSDARALLGLLTGRVTSWGGNLVLDEATNQYVYLGTRRQAGRQNEYSLFAQDSWRWTPTLTINAGVRWDVQMPFEPVNDVLSMSTFADACGVSGIGEDGKCRFFQPGAAGGKNPPTFVQYDKGNLGWKTDWNNVAPNIGVAWRPNVQSGWLRTLLGDPDQATLRAGYSVNYAREGMAVYTGQFGANPGSQVSVTENEDNGLLVPPGETWPLFLSERFRLTPPNPASFPAVACDSSGACRPAYPIAARPSRQDSLNIFHPDIQVAFARSYTISFQRALSRNMAVDIRYVGTRGVNQWTEEDYNERNLIENGFFDEFRLAMANLQANIGAGRGNTFAYTGVPGTSPLPIYLAYFNASNDATNPAAYTGGNWSNSDFYNRLAVQNPSPTGAAGDLDGNNGRRNNAIAAGRPANLFVVNPAVSGVGVFTSDAYSKYDALQIELRRRLSRGFQINGSYQYALEGGSAFLGRHYGRVINQTANVRHAIKVQWDWSVPVGRGRRFGTDMNPILDGILGGWEFNGAGRIQARVLNFGNVRLVGMSLDDLTNEYRFRILDDPDNPGRQIVSMLPDDIILNTRRAFSVSATSATGYSDLGVPEGRYIAPANSSSCIQLKSGDCAPRTTLVRAPWFSRFDIGVTKKFMTSSRVNFELRFDMLNVFDNVNFNPVANPGTGETIFRATSAYQDTSNTFDPGGRLGQIVWRINW
jgi:hypothetical protein